jgi:hypothetical protein
MKHIKAQFVIFADVVFQWGLKVLLGLSLPHEEALIANS